MDNIYAFEGDNIGGLYQFKFIPYKDIAVLPTAVNGVITDNIILNNGKQWFSASMNLDTVAFDEVAQKENKGLFFEQTLTGKIAKDDPSMATLLAEIYTTHKFIVIAIDNNGSQKVMGTLDSPAKFSFVRGTGDTASSFNGFKISFVSRSKYHAPAINATLDTSRYPACVIATFDPVLIKDQDGTTIDVLTSGQTYNVLVIGAIRDDGVSTDSVIAIP